jgi:hypothetical protein
LAFIMRQHSSQCVLLVWSELHRVPRVWTYYSTMGTLPMNPVTVI